MNAPCGHLRRQGTTPAEQPDAAATAPGLCSSSDTAASGAASIPPPQTHTDRHELSDEQLLAAYRQGDTGCFALLVQRYESELFHFLVRFLGDRAAAEDVFQETFLQIHQSADQFDPDRRFRPWLFTIAANKARDLLRSQTRRATSALEASVDPASPEGGDFLQLMSSSAPPADTRMEETEMQRMVQTAVMNMPGHLREILILSYFHEFSYKQIADILGVPLGTVKSRLHAAVACFAELWANISKNKLPPR